MDSTEGRSISSYEEYPLTSITLPKVRESTQQAVISALKNLQEKILKLELERKLEESDARLKTSQTDGTHYNQEVSQELVSAKSRCEMLQKQLSYFRRMVHQQNKNQKSGITDIQDPCENNKEFEKLTLNNYKNSKKKIQSLEEKLKIEQVQRQLTEKKAQELQKKLEKTTRFRRTSKQPKKVHTCVSLKTNRVKKPAPSGSLQHQVIFKNIPFIVGKATTPSHNFGLNIQELMALANTRNQRLCKVNEQLNPAKRKPPLRSHSAPIRSTPSPIEKSTYKHQAPSISATGISEVDLSELLADLKDEFAYLSYDYQEKINQIREENNETVRRKLEKEVEELSKRIDAKSNQIAQVKTFIEKKKPKRKEGYSLSRPIVTDSSENDEILVTTTVRTKGKKAQPIQIVNLPSRDLQLKMFQDVKTLQTTLKKDDIFWN